jgi:hypothetical protein
MPRPHLPQLLGRDTDQFSRSLESLVTVVRGLPQSGHWLGRRSVFALRDVIGTGVKAYREFSDGSKIEGGTCKF